MIDKEREREKKKNVSERWKGKEEGGLGKVQERERDEYYK